MKEEFKIWLIICEFALLLIITGLIIDLHNPTVLSFIIWGVVMVVCAFTTIKINTKIGVYD